MILSRLLAATFIASLSLCQAVAAQERQDYCQYGTRSVLIFVDRTTAYDEIDKAVFIDGFDRIMKQLRIGDAVSVHTIQDDYTSSSVVFSHCLPGCPEEGFLNWVTGSCKPVIARGDLSDFRVRLATTIKSMLDHPQSFRHSDILRTINSVARTYQARAATNQRSKVGKLFVFSDLLENSEMLPWSQVRSSSPSQLLDVVQKSGVVPQLSGASVSAFGFGRSHNPGREALDAATEQRLAAFWTSYFKLGGASEVYVGQNLN